MSEAKKRPEAGSRAEEEAELSLALARLPIATAVELRRLARKACAASRDEALSEAKARVRDAWAYLSNGTRSDSHYAAGLSDMMRETEARLDATQAAPAQVVPAAKVREVLNAEMYAGEARDLSATERTWNDAIRACAKALDMDLDAATSGGSLDDLCIACRVPERRHMEHGCHEFQPAARLGTDE